MKTVTVRLKIPDDLDTNETLSIASDRLEEVGFQFLADSLRSVIQTGEVPVLPGYRWTQDCGWRGRTKAQHLFHVDGGLSSCGIPPRHTYQNLRLGDVRWTNSPENPCLRCLKAARRRAKSAQHFQKWEASSPQPEGE